MRHGSLFSGIGGFDLAAEWMGWDNVFQVEKDPFCQKVLAKNFPKTKRYGDIREFDGTQYRGAIDILSGGFPCQPYSIAGQRKGTEDDRHLWPEMLRIIGEVQPRWVVGENVSGLLNWSGGLVLKQIKTDLEDKGFTMLPPAILPACGKNAPHRRDRLWIIAHSTEYFSNYEDRCGNGSCQVSEERFNEPALVTDTNQAGLQRCSFTGSTGSIWENSGEQPTGFIRADWQNFPTQSPICGRNDGISYELYIIERINENEVSNQKSVSERNIIIWKTMRTMWEQRDFAEASPKLWFDKMCDSLSIVPCKSGSIGWIQENEEAKELRGMWESFFSKPFEEAQNMQSEMLEYYRQIKCRKTVEKRDRINRIKSLGNSVVPQLVYEIFKAIEQTKSQ